MMSIRPAFLAVLVSCLAVGSSVYSADPKPERQVSVQGRGKISAAPDVARIWVQVSEEGKKVETATQLVRTQMEAVLKTVKSHGVAEKDIQTQAYSVAPKVEWKSGRSERIGYTASNRIEVKVHDLKKAGTILAAVLDAGANEVSGPQFGFDNPQELERQALSKALEDAKAKAALLAKAAGASLGEVLRIDESSSYQPPVRPMMAMRSMAMEKSAVEPIASGEETIEATVTAAFLLK